MKDKSHAAIATLSLIIGLFLVRSQFIFAFAAQEIPDTLFSASGLLAIVLYSVTPLVGLLSLLAVFWSLKPLGDASFGRSLTVSAGWSSCSSSWLELVC